MQRMDYSNRVTMDIPGVEVCTRCVARWRRYRVVLWLTVLGLATAAFWWLHTHP